MRAIKMFVPLALAFLLGATSSQDLAQVQAVYLLPMGHGVDQYLANKLTRAGVFRVVTDPKLADAVFTETLGPGFEDKMKELYPPPPEAQPKAEGPKAEGPKAEGPKAEGPKAATDEEKAAKAEEPKPPKDDEKAVKDDTNSDQPRERSRPKMTSWARGKGNVFLVSRQSRTVIWSAYDKPKDTRPHTLDQMADRVVNRLKKDLGRQ